RTSHAAAAFSGPLARSPRIRPASSRSADRLPIASPLYGKTTIIATGSDYKPGAASAVNISIIRSAVEAMYTRCGLTGIRRAQKAGGWYCCLPGRCTFFGALCWAHPDAELRTTGDEGVAGLGQAR